MAYGPDSACGHVLFDLYSVGLQRVFLFLYFRWNKLPTFKNKEMSHTDPNRPIILQSEMLC